MYSLGRKFFITTDSNFEYQVERIIFDSRIAQKGDLFIPLKGLNYDGEDFCNDAINKGAAVLTTRNINGPAPVQKVKDVYKELLEICKTKLLEIKPKIILSTWYSKFESVVMKNFLPRLYIS